MSEIAIPHIEIKVLGYRKGYLILKVSFPDIGMYINGFRIIQYDQDRTMYIVDAPKSPPFFRKYLVEFNKQSDLWRTIQERCHRVAIEYFKDKHPYEPTPYEMKMKSLEK